MLEYAPISPKEGGEGKLYLKITEIWKGKQSNVYVDKSALKTFISGIKMVAKQKECVTFPNGIEGRNMSMEYFIGRHMS